MADHYGQHSAKAARGHIGHQDYLAQLTKGEIDLRHDRSTARRIRNARFPVIKTLDQAPSLLILEELGYLPIDKMALIYSFRS